MPRERIQKQNFPPGFLWGAATSAYQIEGSPLADGAGASIWQRFSHTPGMTANGDTGDIACDHYKRWREDIVLMRELGLNAYRFSIAWGRILPEGTGRVNEGGLDFYRHLVDALLEAGITPMATLYHWDLPEALDNRGGWLNRDIAGWFADYANIAFKALDDRVPFWATLNEPWVVTDGGYLRGPLAPGHRNVFEAPIATHNLMRSHGAAVASYRAIGKHEIGVVVNLEPKYPASEAPADIEATRRADAYMNRQYLDPVFLGSYPPEMKEMFGEAWHPFLDSDLEATSAKIDFLGINYYTRGVMKNDPSVSVESGTRVRQPNATYTDVGWEVYEEGLTDILVWIKDRYGDIPMYITENGAAFYDPPVASHGRVDDPLRVDYYQRHLRAAHAAMTRGVDLRGYFAWSLMDNLEWSHGFSKRFGLVHVNFATQERTPKASARFYSEVIRTNGAVLFQ